MTDSIDDKLIQLMYETIKSLADAEKAKCELELLRMKLEILRLASGNSNSSDDSARAPKPKLSPAEIKKAVEKGMERISADRKKGIRFSNDEKTLLRYSGALSELSYEIPYGITCIGAKAFHKCKLQSVTIPETVVAVKEEAFAFCANLTEISLPENLEEIGRKAFYCSGISRINIPASVKIIGEGAFSNWENNLQITSDNASYIISPEGALIDKKYNKILFFHNQQENYAVPMGIFRIGDSAFLGCDKLKTISIADSVNTIGADACAGCGIEKLEIPGHVSNIGDLAFAKCKKLRACKIPSSVSIIGNEAFAYCDSLEDVSIDQRISMAGKNIFHKCRNLSYSSQRRIEQFILQIRHVFSQGNEKTN